MVTVIETTADGGRKILISGGGRCNVLPEKLEPERFVTDSSPRLLQRMLRSFPIRAQRAFIEDEVGVPLKLEPETRKWFPVSDRARDIRDGLVALARRRGVRFQFSTELTGLERTATHWRVQTTAGEIEADAVVLATGGLSVPTTGSTGTGMRLAAALGHVVHETYAALTPLLAMPSPHASLSGVSLDVGIVAESARHRARSRGGFLFTHRGYSGPAVLDVSHVAVRSAAAGDTPRAAVRVNWSELDERAWHDELVGAPGLVVSAVTRRVPHRLAERLVAESGIPPNRSRAELRREERQRLIDRLTRYELPWTGDEGYRKAEVTGGGVALDEVDPTTLESRRQQGLFLCGEMLDAFGPIGGHNFSWAWATGRLAGLGTARS
jgi:predicted Rossmann fold flavoprotein